MFAVNRKHGVQHSFFDIQYNLDDKYWYAWFMEIIELSNAFAEAENGE